MGILSHRYSYCHVTTIRECFISLFFNCVYIMSEYNYFEVVWETISYGLVWLFMIIVVLIVALVLLVVGIQDWIQSILRFIKSGGREV